MTTVRVLIIDDEPALAELLAEYIRDAHITTEWTTNLNEAVDLISGQFFDFALVDVTMPEMDGVAWVRTLPQKHPVLPAFVFMTGHSDHAIPNIPGVRVIALLNKPFKADDFKKTIADFLSNP